MTTKKGIPYCDSCDLRLAEYEPQVKEGHLVFHDTCARKRKRMKDFLAALVNHPKPILVIPRHRF